MILGALKQYYDLKREAGGNEAPPAFGYSAEKIDFVLVLGADGRPVDEPTDLRDTTAKKPKPKILTVPQPVKRTSGIAANFLWDKSSYVLGISANSGERLCREHEAFVLLHRDALADSDDPELLAFLAFLEAWQPEDCENWPNRDAVLDSNLVFRFDGEQHYLHERPAAQLVWSRMLGSRGNAALTCLVTGDQAPAATLHPAIKGVYGGQSSGGSIISFNQDAFTSYGKVQGQNAPVSEAAAFAYTTALNQLLRPGSGNRVQIGDASTVFWAEGRAGSDLAELAVFGAISGADALDGKQREIDSDTAGKIGHILQQMAEGRPIEQAAPDIDPDIRLYVLGLAPNASRISIRFWHVDSLGALYARFAEHFADLQIEPSPFNRPPSIWRLLIETAVGGKSENIPKQLAGEVMRAVLTGRSYPRTLLSAAIMRMRSDRESDKTTIGIRAAIIRACLNRECRKALEKEIVPVSLDVETINPGYRLGRLFAVLENIQRDALGQQVNATIRDKYYGAASATPASIFPVLLRNTQHHLSKISKDKGGLATHFDRSLGEILDGLDEHFPRHLKVEDQGRFALGYYHQRMTRSKKSAADDGGINASNSDKD